MTNPFFAAMVLDPFVVYIVGMSLVVILAGIFCLSIWYYIKAKDLAPCLRTIKTLEYEIAKLTAKREELLAERTDAEEKIRQRTVAEEWLRKAKEEIETTQVILTKIREEFEAAKVQLEDLKRRVSEEQQVLIDINKKKSEAEDRIKDAEKAVESIRKENAELSVQVPKLKAECDGIVKDITDARREKANLEKNLRNLSDKVSEAKGELERLNGEIAIKKIQLENLATDSEKLSKENEKLSNEKSDLSVEIGRLKGEKDAEKEESERRKAKEDEAKKKQANMWNDLERPVATITGKPIRRVALDDEQSAIETFINNLSDSHFKFNERTIKAFHTGLLCGDISPLVVLAGISGTGKSLLPELYASHFGMNFLPVAIQPRWDGPQDMFGFYNHMEGRYKATELSRLLYQFDIYNNSLASKTYKEQSALPMSIVLLDEMNLARIEYYFSELLSKLEMRRNVVDLKSKMDRFKAEIELEYGAPAIGTDNGISSQIEGKRIFAARNILFIGTMNEDESTQTLSSKVIDRSNVLRFGIPGMLKQTPDRKAFDERCKWYVPFGTWDKWAQIKGAMPGGINIDDLIKQLNVALDSVDRGFGLRTETAFKTYVQRYPGMKRDAIADQVAMKVLPRLNGVERDVVRGRTQSAISKVLQAVGDERVLAALDNALSDSASSFFSWKGVNWEGAAG